MGRKKWVVRSYDKEKVSIIAEKLNINPYAVLIAATRGVDSIEKASDFFGLNESESVEPLCFPDMDIAVARIQKALDNFERIAVYGDYDADGVTATALLYLYLEMQGGDVVYALPDRHADGYGLNNAAVDKLKEMGAQLIITVDNGISAIEQAAYIKECGMELIITDHHLPSDELPQAIAVIDPHRKNCKLPFRDYAGVGVAYKLICAVEGENDEVTESFLDLVALGTIADVMPLIGENRRLVRRGVELLNASERVGVQALREIAGLGDKELTAVGTAFGLVPRINAAGRMGSALRAVRMLMSDDYDEALELAEEINGDNVLRQQTEQLILKQALAQIEENYLWQYNSVIVVDGENWHDGVIGIVASRLVERFGKPVIVITKNAEIAKGSGRSIEGFNLYDALNECSSVLKHFGGHRLAAGIGLESSRIDEFRQLINNCCEASKMPVQIQNIDFKINPAYVNVELLDVLSLLEPFGTANPQPVFGLYNMLITDIQSVGNGKHLKITLKRDNSVLTAMKFRVTRLEFPFEVGDVVDIAVTLEANEYMGQKRLSIYIRNIKMHSVNDEDLIDSIQCFERIMCAKATNDDAANSLPDRNSAAQVYKFIRSRGSWGYDIEMLCYRMGRDEKKYAETAVALEALLELGTLVRDPEGNITLPEKNEKVNLDDAPVLIRIKNLNT